ncbi:hypothetical protein EYB25_001101 [Talaromyces marneffei]|nr:hypothetical protein EYB25_001101 [Talaromyces marneffei]
MLGLISKYTLVSIVYLGAFSRFTHGRYTPAFYRYQLDRAPDNGSTRIIPVFDSIFATLVLFPKTRPGRQWICGLQTDQIDLVVNTSFPVPVPDPVFAHLLPTSFSLQVHQDETECLSLLYV